MAGPAQTQQQPATEPAPEDGAFVVVNLDNAEGSELQNNKKERKKEASKNASYGSPGEDIELGQRAAETKHVNNGSKEDAAEGETVCRVCHLSLTSSESINLGCACKQDLALCHRVCAEEWFKIRGNTVCEICGETAKNVRLLSVDTTLAAATTAAANAGNGGANGVVGSAGNGPAPTTAMSRLRYLWTNQLIRNSLLATMIVVFMVPWFFRIAYF